MELYFLRHGDAGSREGWKGSDATRPLSPEGVARMEKEAAALARLRIPAEVVLTSPLVRARQTAEIAARGLGIPDRVIEDKRLEPGFDAGDLAGILQDHRDRQALLLVGHEPDFSTVISACIGGGLVECKKGGVARVDLRHPGSREGILVWLLPPRVLAPET